MCGIFGQITDDVSKINIDKIKILGIMNETRGTTSCGIAIDGEIYIGFKGTESTFRNFAVNIRQEDVQKSPFVFGHTRRASAGMASTESNAHPFGFGLNEKLDKGFAFMGAHNGTLHNHDELAKQYGIVTRVTKTSDTGVEVFERFKIDSEVLLEIIYQNLRDGVENPFGVLSEYEGGAALVFVDTVKNKVYLYSGASKEYSTSSEAKEERPLHVYTVDDTNIYFSSEADPLFTIGGGLDDVAQIPYNTVLEFTPGKFKDAVSHSVEREFRLQKKQTFYQRNASAEHSTGYSTCSGGGSRTIESVLPKQNNSSNVQKRTEENSSSSEKSTVIKGLGLVDSTDYTKLKDSVVTTKANIRYDYLKQPLLPIREYGKRPYYYNMKLRKSISGDGTSVNTLKSELQTGVFVFIPTYGYHKVGDNMNESIAYFNKNKHGKLNVVNQAIEFTITHDTRDVLIPLFKSTDLLFDNDVAFFFKGIRLETYHDLAISLSRDFDVVSMSHASVYPIFDDVSGKFYYKGLPYTGDIDGNDLEFIYECWSGEVGVTRIKLRHPSLEFLNGLRKYNLENNLKLKTSTTSHADKLIKRNMDVRDILSLKSELSATLAKVDDLEIHDAYLSKTKLDETKEISTQNDEAFLKTLEANQIKTSELIKESVMIEIMTVLTSAYIKYVIESEVTTKDNPVGLFFNHVEEELGEYDRKELAYFKGYLKTLVDNDSNKNRYVKDIYELLNSYYDGN